MTDSDALYDLNVNLNVSRILLSHLSHYSLSMVFS